MTRRTGAELVLRSELARKIAETIHGRMHFCEFLPGPFHWNFVGDPEDKTKSSVTTMSAYDILDRLEDEGYSIVKK